VSGCTLFCDQKSFTYQATDDILTLKAELLVDDCNEDQLEITDIQYKDELLVTKVVITLLDNDEVLTTMTSDETEVEYEGEEEDMYEPIFQLNEYLKIREILFSKATIEDSYLSSYRLRVEITTTSNQEITLETGFEKIEK
jgi:hypothetical protein